MTRRRATWFAIAALALSVAAGANAQIVRATGLSPFVKDYKIDFAIPDAPAFKLLEVDQSAILRPQTVRDLAVVLDGFRGEGNAFVVPRQLGVEFSPGLLIGGGQLHLTDYAARKALYALRLSGATNRDSLNHGQPRSRHPVLDRGRAGHPEQGRRRHRSRRDGLHAEQPVGIPRRAHPRWRSSRADNTQRGGASTSRGG